VQDGEEWKQFAVKSTAFSALARAECSPRVCQSKTPRRCLRCLGVHFARVVRDARNADGIKIRHRSKRMLSASWQQRGVVEGASVSWNCCCLAACSAGSSRHGRGIYAEMIVLSWSASKCRSCSAACVQVPARSSRPRLSSSVSAQKAEMIASLAYSQNSSVFDMTPSRCPDISRSQAAPLRVPCRESSRGNVLQLSV
jgi:hypothetical protein